jgi:hypothetical protein
MAWFYRLKSCTLLKQFLWRITLFERLFVIVETEKCLCRCHLCL